jgi:hypothetical protein
MLESVLSFLRNGCRLEAMTPADVASTLQLITDQFADMGCKVGAEAVIRLRVSQGQLTIDVEDDGPGISDALKQNMLEPFVRGGPQHGRSGRLRPRSFDHQRHRNRAWRHAVAARPAAAWTGGSDAIADPPEQRPRCGLDDDYDFRRRARRDAPLHRSRSLQSDNRRHGRTRGTTCGQGCSQPNRASQSAFRIGHRDFHEVNSRNRVEPLRISLLTFVMPCYVVDETGSLSERTFVAGKTSLHLDCVFCTTILRVRMTQFT